MHTLEVLTDKLVYSILVRECLGIFRSQKRDIFRRQGRQEPSIDERISDPVLSIDIPVADRA